MAHLPQFWGLEVLPKKAAVYQCEENNILTINQVALGPSPKAGERCTVSITVDQQAKCALGTLVKGSCDQFSVGAGLFFSDGPKVVFSHNGSSAVYVTGTQQLTAEEEDGSEGDDDDEDDEEPPSLVPMKCKTPEKKLLAPPDVLRALQAQADDDDDSDDEDSDEGEAGESEDEDDEHSDQEEVDQDDGPSLLRPKKFEFDTPSKGGNLPVQHSDSDSDDEGDLEDSADSDDSDDSEDDDELPSTIGSKRGAPQAKHSVKSAKHFDAKDGRGRGGRSSGGKGGAGRSPGGRGGRGGRGSRR